MATLYRKYRPKEFKETVGQNHIKVTLQSEIQAENIAHAYLFCGPRGVGKTTLARVFAKAINCTNRKGGEYEPCNQCDSCAEINDSRSLDIVEIDAASHTGVDNVRDNIIASARTAPTRSKYKVFIIDEVHMLSISAFNALLKIIEEPPAHVVFILCTTETHKVPATIISRCQRFDFKRISVSDLSKKLAYIAQEEGVKVDKAILEKIARQSEGYARDAEGLLGQVLSISGKEVTKKDVDLVIPRSDIDEMLELIDVLARKDSAKGVELANRLVNDGIDLKIFVSGLIEILRKLLLARVSPGLSEKFGIEFGEKVELKLSDLNKMINANELVKFIDKFLEVRNKIKDSFIIQLPLELAIVELCSLPATNAQSIVNSTPLPNAGAGATESGSVSAGPEDGLGAGISNVKASALATHNLTLNDILTKWREVIVLIKKNNHSLSFVLRASQPRQLKGNVLELAFKYKFHRDRLDDGAVKDSIEQALVQVYNTALSIEGVVDEGLVVGNGGGGGVTESGAPQAGETALAPSAPTESAPIPTEEVPAEKNQAEAIQPKPTSSEFQPNIENSEAGGDNPMLNNILKTFGGKVVK